MEAVIRNIFLLALSIMEVTCKSPSLPYFMGGGKYIKAEVNESVRLSCDVVNLGNYLVLWKKNQLVLTAGPLKVVRDARFKLLDNFQLEINPLNATDSGNYTCEINTEPTLKKVVTLDISVPPSILSTNDVRIQIIKGEPLALKCLANGNPQPNITWTSQNFNGQRSGFLLDLGIADRVHSGTYLCTASNGVGQPVKAIYEVNVLYAPLMVDDDSIIHTTPGKDATLVCQTDGEPPPILTWYQGNKLVIPSERRIIESSGDSHRLIVHQISDFDLGNYTCVAENVLGRAQRVLELTGRPLHAKFLSNPIGVSKYTYIAVWVMHSYNPLLEFRLLIRPELQADERSGVWRNIVIPADSTVINNQSIVSLHKFINSTVDIPSSIHGYQLTNLTAGTEYQLIAQGRNKYGWSDSDPTQIFHFVTAGARNKITFTLDKSFGTKLRFEPDPLAQYRGPEPDTSWPLIKPTTGISSPIRFCMRLLVCCLSVIYCSCVI